MTEEFLQPNIEDETFKEAQRLAEKAQNIIKEKYELTLNNIDFVELRRIATQVLNELKINPDPKNLQDLDDFYPDSETAARFIKEIYGVIYDDFFTGIDHLTSEDGGIDYDKRKEQMKEYLRKKQDEMHKL